MVWEKPAASIRMRMHGSVPVRIVFVKWKNYIKLKQKKSCPMTRVKFYRHRTGLFLFYFAISLLYFSHIFILHLAHTCFVRNVFLYVCCLSLAGML